MFTIIIIILPTKDWLKKVVPIPAMQPNTGPGTWTVIYRVEQLFPSSCSRAGQQGDGH